MKKLLIALISLLMVVTLFGCKKTNGNSYNIESGEKPENNIWNLDGTIFPLKNKVKFTVLTEGYSIDGYKVEDLANNYEWQQLMEATNIEIEFVSIGKWQADTNRDTLQLRLMSEEYGDAIWSWYINDLTTADIDELGSTGVFVALEKYMEDATIMPNFNANIVSNANTYKNMHSADGSVYSFMGVNELKANDAGEALMQVNTEWLNAWKTARGVDHSPETLAEFEDMLVFFRDNDLNGNGTKDETAYFICQSYMLGGCASFEHAMGMYGIGTKDSALDMDIMINDDGECYYVYTTDAYKEALGTFSKWYGEGLIWEEAFTGNQETVTAFVADAKNNFGVINICEPIEGFEAILPPTVEGYKSAYHMHPSARTVTRQSQAVITNKCEHPEILAAFFDLFYNYENYITYSYGSVNIGEGKYVQVDEDGRYKFNVGEWAHSSTKDSPLGLFLATLEYATLEDFDEKVDLEAYYAGRIGIYKGSLMYREAGVWNKTANLWPRCSILEDDATDYAFKYTDVKSVVAEYRAKFITGAYDVDTQWDEFQNKIKALGVEDMTAIIQRAYDAWNNR